MSWPQIVGDDRLPGRFGIYGEATSYLLDPNGVVIGRDLKGSNLVRAIRQTLSR